MKKLLCLFLFPVSIFYSIFAITSHDFLIGAYSIKNRTAVSNFGITPEYVKTRLSDAHYNNVQAYDWTHFYGYSSDFTDFSTLLTGLNNAGIDANVHDDFYPDLPLDLSSNDVDHVPGIDFLTSSCYFRFEAEYDAQNCVVNDSVNDDYHFYRFGRDKGSIFHDQNHITSNSNYWKCSYNPNNDSTWVTISGDMYYRWATTAEGNRVNWLCKFARKWDDLYQSHYLQEDSLHISVALNWLYDPNSSDSLIADSSLIEITFEGVTPLGERISGLNFVPPEHNPYGSTLKVDDFIHGTPDPDHPTNGFHIFTYAISLAELENPDNSTQSNRRTLLNDKYELMYVIPIIKWKQNKTVSLDYIEYEDNVHKAMRAETALDKCITKRLDNYQNSNIDNYMGINEPDPGNFDSYRLIKESISRIGGSTNHPITNSVNARYICSKPDGSLFSNIRNFDHYANPEVQVINRYPLTITTDFNNEASPDFFQKKLDLALEDYRVAKEYLTETTPHEPIPFYAAVQCYGDWNDSNQRWIDKLFPTYTTQKCLQYLPLCYGPDGIIDFALSIGNLTEITPLEYHDNLPPRATYDALVKANEKIAIYGPIVKRATWYGAECLHALASYHDFSITDHLFANHFADISIPDTLVDEDYNGYIQCGYYHNDQENYYMLVNRRTDQFSSQDTRGQIYPEYGFPMYVPLANYDYAYTTHSPQTLEFKLQDDAISLYGVNPGLYDPATHDLQLFDTSGNAYVTLVAGEASLRQIVTVLPAIITADLTINRDVCVATDVSIQNGCTVTIASDKVLNLQKNSRIYVRGSSTLCIQGKLFADSLSKIVVDNSGILDINNAECEMADSSSIECSGILCIGDSELNSVNGSTWQGIKGNGANIQITGSTISNAVTAFELIESNFTMGESTKINVPSNGTGIFIASQNNSDPISLNGGANHKNSIIGLDGAASSTGILMNSIANSFSCNWTNFQNLYRGILYVLSEAKSDSVSNCTFERCNTGMSIIGNGGLAKISSCSFNIDSNKVGVITDNYIPLVQNCIFDGNTPSFNTGIYLDSAHGWTQADILECTFDDLSFGIESRESEARLKADTFSQNTYGINNHNYSLLDCSNNANNVFINNTSNLSFMDNSVLGDSLICISTIQLMNGHNDFYHSSALSHNDFQFAHTFDYSGSEKICATGNYWSTDINGEPDDSIYVVPVTQSNFVDIGIFDTEPNSPDSIIIADNRYEEALQYENEGDYNSAYILYKQILSEQVPEEEDYWKLCIPSIFDIALGHNLDYDDLVAYYDMELTLVDDIKADLFLLINAYKANTCLANKDYQAAADIISSRISNPISEADSLEAVMDLEIVYLLRDMDGAKRPLSTNFTQYHYPNLQTFNVKHEVNRLKLQALINRDHDTDSSVPATVILSRNYPNPFNPTTTIEFGLPKSSKVSIKIYNIRGQLVKELVNQRYEPGKYKTVWEGKNEQAKKVASGVYFYRLEAAGKCFTHKMLLLK